jgi:aryl-alcohol dehydrogenase-like predicted oxidoreductase
MTFGGVWKHGENELRLGGSDEESRRVFETFAEAGGTFIDTAVNYTNGRSEELLGQFLGSERDHFVVATKYSGEDVDNPDLNQGGNGRKNMVFSVEQSLRRLKTEYVDVYYLHVWEYTTPLDEVLRAADDLVRQGKVLHFAFSDSPSWIVSEAVARTELRGWSRPIAVQVPYSLTRRDVERNTLPMAEYHDLAVCVWAPLDGGVLTGKYGPQAKANEPRRLDIQEPDAQVLKVVEAVQAIATEVGRSAAQVAINWTRQKQHAQVIPIVGARRPDQIADNLKAVEWELTAEQIARLEQAGSFELGYPEQLIAGASPLLFGSNREKLDNHRVRGARPRT